MLNASAAVKESLSKVVSLCYCVAITRIVSFKCRPLCTLSEEIGNGRGTPSVVESQPTKESQKCDPCIAIVVKLGNVPIL